MEYIASANAGIPMYKEDSQEVPVPVYHCTRERLVMWLLKVFSDVFLNVSPVPSQCQRTHHKVQSETMWTQY
jgi:hypothetical protein